MALFLLHTTLTVGVAGNDLRVDGGDLSAWAAQFDPIQSVKREMERTRSLLAEHRIKRDQEFGAVGLEEDEVLAALAAREKSLENTLRVYQSRCDTARPCPICGGKLVPIKSINDDRSRPSRNVNVWNRSMCANLRYLGVSPICKRCWTAQSIKSGEWSRASFNADSFFRPLAKSIRKFPIPQLKGDLVPLYEQKSDGGQLRETIFFGTRISKEYLQRAMQYAAQTGLTVHVETGGDYVSLRVSTSSKEDISTIPGLES